MMRLQRCLLSFWACCLLGSSLLIAGHSSLKIASWNVENLFDMQRQGTEYDEYIPGHHGWSEAMLRKKLRNVAEVICDVDADVIGLQEVENDRVLERLQQLLKQVGCPYRYRAITTGAGRPVHVAALSRIRIARKREIPVTRNGRERRILALTLATDPPLKLFINHWRSKSGPESQRVLYAKALRRRLMKLPAGTEYLVLGDFNSDYREYRILDRRHNDTGGITGINHILGTIDSRGHLIRYGTLRNPPSPGRIRHMSLWTDLENGQRWSHNFYGDKEAIDAILIPPSLADHRGWEYRRGSFAVFHPPYLFGKHGEVKRWAYRHGKHLGKGFSDHLPVFAIVEQVGEGDKMLSSKGADGPSRVLPAMKFPLTTIGALQKKQKLASPVRLEQITLIFRRGRFGVFQARPGGPAILLYGAAAGLREGGIYNVTVYGFKRYKGMPEITDLESESLGEKRDVLPFISPFDPGMMREAGQISHIVRGIRGCYRNRRIEVRGHAIPLHFKKRSWQPKSAVFLRIKRAQIGYYKNHRELVIWDPSDFEVVRK